MSQFARFSSPKPCRDYTSHLQLYQGLQAMDNRAILCLQRQALPMVRKTVAGMGGDADKVEEVLNQSTLILLQKIKQGSYEFKGHAPTTYVVEVAKRLTMAMIRRKKRPTEQLEDQHDLGMSDFKEAERRRASAELVRRFLSQMGEACAQVIRLHHIDGFSDEEVIKKGLTAYSTKNSLKMKRSTCMKKLIEIAQKWKTSQLT